jgi:hypothetical protein
LMEEDFFLHLWAQLEIQVPLRLLIRLALRTDVKSEKAHCNTDIKDIARK